MFFYQCNSQIYDLMETPPSITTISCLIQAVSGIFNLVQNKVIADIGLRKIQSKMRQTHEIFPWIAFRSGIGCFDTLRYCVCRIVLFSDPIFLTWVNFGNQELFQKYVLRKDRKVTSIFKVVALIWLKSSIWEGVWNPYWLLWHHYIINKIRGILFSFSVT